MNVMIYISSYLVYKYFEFRPVVHEDMLFKDGFFLVWPRFCSEEPNCLCDFGKQTIVLNYLEHGPVVHEEMKYLCELF